LCRRGATFNAVPPGAGLLRPWWRTGSAVLTSRRCAHREYVASIERVSQERSWNTWLTCEETEQKAGGQYLRDHGYVFEVDAFDRKSHVDPVPLKFLGRHAHEAVAVDPNGTIYLTEDANGPHGLFYRWTPPAGFEPGKGALRALALSQGGATAGSLQAMGCYRGDSHIRRPLRGHQNRHPIQRTVGRCSGARCADRFGAQAVQ
jgi:secreted PhoX family phosphatase